MARPWMVGLAVACSLVGVRSPALAEDDQDGEDDLGVASVSPEDGAVDVDPRSVVEVKLAKAPPAARKTSEMASAFHLWSIAQWQRAA